MKKSILPAGVVIFVLFSLRMASIPIPVYFFSNDFLVQSYQTTSAGLNKGNPEIVIVNISDLSENLIAAQIDILSHYEPAVIALDYYTEDSINLDSVENHYKNLVLPILIENDSIKYSLNAFTKQEAHHGLISLHSSTYFEPFMHINGRRIPSLPTKIIELYDSNLFIEVSRLEVHKQVINYIGNTTSFTYLGDLTQIQSIDELSVIKDKIVLIGYAGISHPFPTKSDNFDAHLTPLGNMFGVVILANVVHTLMGNTVQEMPLALMFVIVLIVASISGYLATFIIVKTKQPYWTIKLCQVALLLIAFTLASITIHQYNTLIDFEVIAILLILLPEVVYWQSRLAKRSSNLTNEFL